MVRSGTTVSLLAALFCAGSSVALANGAFPNSQTVIIPASESREIIVATNFGIVLSQDDGETWTWRCELKNSRNGALYQMGAAPLHRMYAIASVNATAGLVYSDDRGCSWNIAGGSIAGTSVVDAFPDPVHPGRTLAIVTRSDGGLGTSEVWESSDGGATFETRRYVVSGDHLVGIESARSDPATIYLSVLSAFGSPRLGRSTDGGETWAFHDLWETLGSGVGAALIIAVDPVDANKVFLRVSATGGEEIVVSLDGGATIAAVSLVPDGILDGFARLPSGTLILAAHVGATGATLAFRSVDEGMTFLPLPAPPPLRGLAVRGTTLFAALDNSTCCDSPALAVSEDEGSTWAFTLRFDQIQAVATCVAAACREDCLNRARTGQWDAAWCSAPTADGGVTGARKASGCGCELPPGNRAQLGNILGNLVGVLATLWWGRRFGRRAGQHEPPSPQFGGREKGQAGSHRMGDVGNDVPAPDAWQLPSWQGFRRRCFRHHGAGMPCSGDLLSQMPPIPPSHGPC